MVDLREINTPSGGTAYVWTVGNLQRFDGHPAHFTVAYFKRGQKKIPLCCYQPHKYGIRPGIVNGENIEGVEEVQVLDNLVEMQDKMPELKMVIEFQQCFLAPVLSVPTIPAVGRSRLRVDL